MTKIELMNLVSNTFGFVNELREDEKEKLFNESALVKIDRNKIIMSEGMTCGGMVLVMEGVIRIYKLSKDGREISLYRVGKGETCVLSVSCILGSAQYQAIAQVEEDCTVLSIPLDTFNKIFFSSQALQKFVFNTLSSRLAEVMMVVEEIAFQRMDKRVAGFLHEKLERLDGNEIKITHEEIAMDLGSAREVISRILKDFENKGIISISRGSINILKPEGIKNLSLV